MSLHFCACGLAGWFIQILSVVNKIHNFFHGLAGVWGLTDQLKATSFLCSLICIDKRVEFQTGFESRQGELSEGSSPVEEVWFSMFCIFGRKKQEKVLISQLHPLCYWRQEKQTLLVFYPSSSSDSRSIKFYGKGTCGDKAVSGELALHRHCFNIFKKSPKEGRLGGSLG